MFRARDIRISGKACFMQRSRLDLGIIPLSATANPYWSMSVVVPGYSSVPMEPLYG
jgi:hypothetical protein